VSDKTQRNLLILVVLVLVGVLLLNAFGLGLRWPMNASWQWPIYSVASIAAPAPAPAANGNFNVIDAEFARGVTTTVEGPVIVQWWDGSTAGCGIVKVDAGKTFTWALMGHWWKIVSQSALDNGWPASHDAYTTNNPQCVGTLPAGALK